MTRVHAVLGVVSVALATMLTGCGNTPRRTKTRRKRKPTKSVEPAKPAAAKKTDAAPAEPAPSAPPEEQTRREESPAPVNVPSVVRIGFGDDALSKLTVDGEDVLADGAVRVQKVRTADSFRDFNAEEHELQLEVPAARDPYAGETRTFADADAEADTSRADAAAKSVKQSFDWGTLSVAYRPVGRRLDLDVEIANTSTRTVEHVLVDLVALRLPAAAGQYPASRWTKFPAQRSEPVRLVAGRRYYIEALMNENTGGDNLSVAWAGPGIERDVIDGAHLSPANAPDEKGSILREWWTGVPGATVAEFTASPEYPDEPEDSDTVARFDAPADWSDHYGTRLSGYVHPPTTGEYTFWIASDDQGELRLSTDDFDGNAKPVASVPGWVGTGGSSGIVSSQPHWARADANIGAPLVLKHDHAGGLFVVTSAAPGGPLSYQLVGTPEKLAFRAVLGHPTGGAEAYDGTWVARPLKPGGRDRFTVSLVFGDGNEDALALAAHAFGAFREKHPFALSWPDRRPIGAIHLGDNRTNEKNPRGWRHGSGVPDSWDVNAPGAHEEFEKHLLRAAKGTLDVARRTGMQGIIVWQPEGQQHPGAYYGEPRIVQWLAPEMHAAADAYFKALRDGGLRVGICIRPPLYTPVAADGKTPVAWSEMKTIKGCDWTVVEKGKKSDVFDAGGSPFSPKEAQSPLERMDAKVRYAKERWGCTLFYIDTNHFWRPRDRSAEGWKWKGHMITSEVFEELQRRHPDVLLVPEHEYLQYWSSTAPYLQPPNYGTVTPRDVRAAYPDAFSVMCADPGAAPLQAARQIYVDAVVSGDVFMFNGWYGGQSVTDFYRDVALGAPVRAHLGAGGAWKLEHRSGDDANAAFAPAGDGTGMDELAARLRVVLEPAKSVPARRVWIVHEADTAPAALTAAVKAVGDGGGIIAWSGTE